MWDQRPFTTWFIAAVWSHWWWIVVSVVYVCFLLFCYFFFSSACLKSPVIHLRFLSLPWLNLSAAKKHFKGTKAEREIDVCQIEPSASGGRKAFVPFDCVRCSVLLMLNCASALISLLQAFRENHGWCLFFSLLFGSVLAHCCTEQFCSLSEFVSLSVCWPKTKTGPVWRRNMFI